MERACDARRRRTDAPSSDVGLPALLLLALATVFSTACAGRFIGVQPPARIGPSGSSVPGVGLVAGAPIVVTASTRQVPAGPDGRPLTPVGSSNATVLLRSGSQFSGGPVSYELWDPTTGALATVPGWTGDDAVKDRVLGVFEDWAVVTRDQPSLAGSVSVELRNVRSGESHQIGTSGDSSTQGRVVAANGWVAWTDSSQNHSGVWLYEIAGGKNTIVPAMVKRISSLAVANGVVAWWQGQSFNSSQPPRIVVRDIASNDFQFVAASEVRALVLSSDGQTLVWLQDAGTGGPGIYVHDLKAGSGGRLLGGQSIGVSLSVSGDYLSWQPGSGSGASTAGLYNVKTHELRFVQSAPGASTTLSRVMGQWFLWSDFARQPSGASGASPLAGCCYILRLPN